MARHYALRRVPSLNVPQAQFVEFLTNGYGYDNASVAAAVRKGNELFSSGELKSALDFYGAAYDIAKLHYVYPPLMHDLILRRSVCSSMLGDFSRALSEVGWALQVVENSPTAHLMRGILHSKLGATDDANHAFQRAVEQCALLRDVTDCFVALFVQLKGHSDRAIQITSQVLERSPKHRFALLVRGDSFKFHASGMFSQNAADDYAALLELDRNLHPEIGQRLTMESHSRVDKLLLKFHPWFSTEGPRPYEGYAFYQKANPMFTTSLVLLAIVKLRILVRSAKLVKNIWQHHAELVQQRAAAEWKLQNIVDAQRRITAVESHSEVWGPADPDHVLVRKYRRYWMEKPLDFPCRVRKALAEPSAASQSPACVQAHQAVDLFNGGYSSLRRPEEEPCLASALISPQPSTAAPSTRHTQASQDPSIATHRTQASQDAFVSSSVSSCAWQSEVPQDQAVVGHAVSPRQVQSLNDPSTVNLAACMSKLQMSREAAGVSDSPAQAPSACIPETPDLLSSAPCEQSSCTTTSPYKESLLEAAGRLSSECRYAEQDPPPSLGKDWDENQWIAKALELAAQFGASAECDGYNVDLECAPDMKSTTAGSLFASQRLHSAPLEPQSVDGVEVNLVEEIEQRGFEAIPDWYPILDRIYEVTDLMPFSISPEKPIPAVGLAGAPGHSYVVLKAAAYSQSCQSATEEGPELSDALTQRYRNRLLATSLPGRRGPTTPR